MKYLISIPDPKECQTVAEYNLHKSHIIWWLTYTMGEESKITWARTGTSLHPYDFYGIRFKHEQDLVAFKLRFAL